MVRRLISLPCLVMAAWTLTLGWLILDDRYSHFLAPKFKLLVYTGALLSFLFTLGAALQAPGQSRNHLVRGLVLILPILFILSAGDATLGNFAMSKRGIAPVQTAPAASETDSRSGAASAIDRPAPSTDIVSLPQASAPEDTAPGQESGQAPQVPISKLIQNWDAYEGKEVSVEGLFSQTVVGHDELSAIFRYLITCCVADALPVGIFLDRAEVEGLTGDDWVRASGRVNKLQLDGFEIIFMESASVEKREKPSKNAAYFFN